MGNKFPHIPKSLRPTQLSCTPFLHLSSPATTFALLIEHVWFLGTKERSGPGEILPSINSTLDTIQLLNDISGHHAMLLIENE